MRLVILLLLILTIEGCSIKEVKPWQKGTLAKETMQFSGGNGSLRKFTNHIYFSKEASKGGSGVAGGGCGCN